MEAQLATTNWLLGVMAVAAALEALTVVALGVIGIVAVRSAMQTAKRIDAEQVTPALGKVNAILDDVKGVSGTVKDGAGRFDSIIRGAAAAFHSVFEKCSDASKRSDRVM
jgi:hypothetical protein